MSDTPLGFDLGPRPIKSKPAAKSQKNKKPAEKINLKYAPIKSGTDFWQDRRVKGQLIYLYFGQRRDEAKLNIALYQKTRSGFEFGPGLEIGYLSPPVMPHELKQGMESSLGFFAGHASKLGVSFNINFKNPRVSGWRSYVLNGQGFSVSIGGVPLTRMFSSSSDIRPYYYIDFAFYQNLASLPLLGQHFLKLDAVLGASVMLSANFNVREVAPSLGFALSYSYLTQKYLEGIKNPSFDMNVRMGMNFYARGIFPELKVGVALSRKSFYPEVGLAMFYLPQNTADNPYKLILGDASYNKIQEISRRTIDDLTIKGSMNDLYKNVAKNVRELADAFSQISPSLGVKDFLGENIFHHNLCLGLYGKVVWRRNNSRDVFVLVPEVSITFAAGGVISSSRQLVEGGPIKMNDLTRPEIFITGQLGADLFGINYKKQSYRLGVQVGVFSLWTLYGIPYTIFPYLGFNFGGSFSLF